MAEVVINDANFQDFISPVVDGEQKSHGLRPRDFSTHPQGYLACAKPFDLPLIPESEWQSRLDARIAAKAQLSDVRNLGMNGQPIPSRDQDGKGYCFPAGTPVTMADGSKRAIERVAIGDMVMTRQAVPRKVLHTMRRIYTGEMIGLNVRGIEGPLVCTADHLVQMGTRGWMKAAEFQPGDWAIKPTGDGSYTWERVYAVKRRLETALEVFDFEVEEDHHFIANGIVVHNCWAHSSTSAALAVRALNGEPYEDLSAFMVACIIKGYRDEGGWGAESLEFIAQNGIPTSQFWPQQSMSRSNDNPAMRANAKLHRFTDWRDLDPNNMKAQLVTCLLLGMPVVSDFNWWSHSVCTVDLVSLNPFRTRIWNSWGDSWSENGTGILEGSKAIPDSALCAMVMTASQQ